MYNNSMKKKIMKKAWKIHKACKVDLACALRSAWAWAKLHVKMALKFTNFHMTAKRWEKNGKDRLYFVVYEQFSNGWRCWEKRHDIYGYIDLKTGYFVED